MKSIGLHSALLTAIFALSTQAGPLFEADLDGSGEIDFFDLLIVAQQWQTQGPLVGGTQVGWEAELIETSTNYGVSGKAIVTSATSIRLENFNFLNNGPDVFVYLIIAGGPGDFTQQEGEAGLSIFPFTNIDSEPYEEVSLDIPLPQGVTISPYTHVSVWCRLARADFGSGRLSPPGPKRKE
jgi:hypothetical protein